MRVFQNLLDQRPQKVLTFSEPFRLRNSLQCRECISHWIDWRSGQVALFELAHDCASIPVRRPEAIVARVCTNPCLATCPQTRAAPSSNLHAITSGITPSAIISLNRQAAQ